MRSQSLLLTGLFGAVALVTLAAPSHAKSAAEIGTLAQSITVRIEGQNPGSGVLIQKKGNTYTVLTAAHVVATVDEYEVITSDEQTYNLDYRRVQKLPGIDLAIVEFDSFSTYATATIGDSGKIKSGEAVYVSGFPMPTAAITEPIWNFSPGSLTANATRPLADGYSLVYTNNTLPGMSGGAVLNEQGELIGIHGRADAEQQIQKTETIYIKSGFNLGIPVNLFLGIAAEINVSLAPTPAVQPRTPSILSADDYFLRGGEQFLAGQYRQAISSYDQAIQLRPDYAAALNQRGRSRSSLGDRQGAISDFNQAIQIKPDFAIAYVNRGLIGQADNPQEAMTDFDRAIKLMPNYAEAYAGRAIAHAGLKNFNGMIADSSQAIELKPNLKTAYKNRAVGYWLSGKQEKAIADINKAIQLDPDYAWAYDVRGIFRQAQGDQSGAIADWETGAKLAQQQGIDSLYQTLSQRLQESSE